MDIAILLFDQVTALDAVGPYEVLGRLPGARLTFVGERRGEVRTDLGSLALTVDATLEEVPRPDVIVVPGGIGQQRHMTDGPVHRWLRAADATSTVTTAVCTGSLILAAAGLLRGRRATSHWVRREDLAAHGAVPVAERVVTDGKYVTAAGVSAGIDMALTLVDRLAGRGAAEAIQCGIEYDPMPPFDAGSPDKVDPATVARLLTLKDLVF
ncbi:DJ-1/PfpI family protein [Georgenia thermotolerans]|uniref:DJ-1/PfpI family protein n=1 Tax=Georgenia thermotolerans TaxID=527326 RepID=A0A7J5URB3_9MICO|nr:DJ-1/PfpI family protein [Georgenia thermotolerans]KAE8764751.1 DJ-1/PfpI family protein [Georgenia thermotolerans]